MKNSNNLLSGLNDAQVKAVTALNGPVLVIAGAGSGKTKTLVHRLAYLIAEAKIPPADLLAVTFTNKAAQEMKQRVSQILGITNREALPTVGTFHSVSCSFLRQGAQLLNYPAHFSIYDQDDQLSLVKKIIKDFGYDIKTTPPGAVLNLISKAKSNLVKPSEFFDKYENNYFTSLVKKVYENYQDDLRLNQAFDFDDLISEQVYLWRSQPAWLARYHNRYKYILVDEYQDTNHSQYIWVKLLAEQSRNIYVVGDDWQSIYSWRGADFGNILRFTKDYPDAQVIKLEQNYRSTQNIINASNAVMAKAQLKVDKVLWTNNTKGEAIKIVEVADEVAEARYVINEAIRLASDNFDGDISYQPESASLLPNFVPMSRYYDEPRNLSGLVVLYRTNAQSRALEEECLKSGLPYRLVGGVRFYERREIKDMLAYLKLLVNPADSLSFKRAILAPSRGLGLASVEMILKAAQANNLPYLSADLLQFSKLSMTRQQSLASFIAKFVIWQTRLATMTVAELMETILEESGLKQELLDGTEEGESRYQNIEELKTVAAERAPGVGLSALHTFITEVSLWQDQDSLSDNKHGLTLMTVHSAKGLEFETVFLTGLEEGLFPHSSSFDEPEEMEEERRLCYVALTRAKKKVYCIYALNRRLFGNVLMGLPSRFIGEIPTSLIEFKSASPF